MGRLRSIRHTGPSCSGFTRIGNSFTSSFRGHKVYEQESPTESGRETSPDRDGGRTRIEL